MNKKIENSFNFAKKKHKIVFMNKKNKASDNGKKRQEG